jgi:hypothetical protein
MRRGHSLWISCEPWLCEKAGQLGSAVKKCPYQQSALLGIVEWDLKKPRFVFSDVCDLVCS